MRPPPRDPAPAGPPPDRPEPLLLRAVRDLGSGLVAYLLFVAALPVLLTHPKVRDGIRERLGWYPSRWGVPAAGPRIWLHGASAGDVAALEPLARSLKTRRPEAWVLLSTVTSSGRAMAERLGDAFDAVTYLPYDLPGAVGRALRRFRPNVLVLEVTELWPQLIRRAARGGVAVVLNNGRFAPQRLGGYRWLFRITGNLLRQVRLLLMRDPAEAERALALGARAEQVLVTGSTKLDRTRGGPSPPDPALLRALGLSRPVWIAGSTHDGEEDVVLDALVAVRAEVPDLRLVLAPRYVERAPRLVDEVRRRGLKALRRSQVAAEPPPHPPDVVILDSIGELGSFYGAAEVVFVGGSLVPRGGHNILEPAAAGRPVLFGPHMDNVADSVQVLLGRGGIQVASPAQLAAALRDLLTDAALRQEIGAQARRSVLGARGAADRNAAAICGLLSDA